MSELETPLRTWWVYLLQCRGGRLYCGVTVDLDARWAAHVSGKGARFTRAFPPEAILASMKVEGQAEALRLERRIKRLPKGQKVAALSVPHQA